MRTRKAFTGDTTAGKKFNFTPINIVKLAVSVLMMALAIFFTVKAVVGTTGTADTYYLVSDSEQFNIATDIEGIEEEFEESKTIEIEYLAVNYPECFATVEFTEEEWENRNPETLYSFTGYVYSTTSSEETDTEDTLYFGFKDEASKKQLRDAERAINADNQSDNYGAGMAMLFVAIAAALLFFWHDYFSRYEQIWFFSIIVLASIFSVIFPEEDCNGINGLVIMLLYLLDTFLNILCELLISKQSKWNFIVSVFVELTEIAICLVLSYRFATLASTLFFWLPCDIISFVNWHKHPDKQEEELTIVRTLKGWQEALIIAGIVVWTVGLGWFLSGLDITTDIFGGNETLATIVCYMDACATAVGICNGLFILFRFREQWIAWYIEAALETAMNILAGQYVLLILKLGYFTNTTYGYIKWTKYIKKANGELPEEKKPSNKHAKIPQK